MPQGGKMEKTSTTKSEREMRSTAVYCLRMLGLKRKKLSELYECNEKAITQWTHSFMDAQDSENQNATLNKSRILKKEMQHVLLERQDTTLIENNTEGANARKELESTLEKGNRLCFSSTISIFNDLQITAFLNILNAKKDYIGVIWVEPSVSKTATGWTFFSPIFIPLNIAPDYLLNCTLADQRTPGIETQYTSLIHVLSALGVSKANTAKLFKKTNALHNKFNNYFPKYQTLSGRNVYLLGETKADKDALLNKICTIIHTYKFGFVYVDVFKRYQNKFNSEDNLKNTSKDEHTPWLVICPEISSQTPAK